MNIDRKNGKVHNLGGDGINTTSDRGKSYTSIRNRRFNEKSGSCVAVISVMSEAREARHPKPGSWNQPGLRYGKDSRVIRGYHLQNFVFLRAETRASGVAGGRSIQRPRYYSTELGMRAPLLAGVLAAAAGPRAAALNTTARLLHPALKFFITAGSRQQASGGLANVVGFTDTREMLKPFHALKYLADNFLDEYDFFFLVSDATYINARRLTELVSRLSVSQDVYMGTRAEDDSHYCSLGHTTIITITINQLQSPLRSAASATFCSTASAPLPPPHSLRSASLRSASLSSALLDCLRCSLHCLSSIRCLRSTPLPRCLRSVVSTPIHCLRCSPHCLRSIRCLRSTPLPPCLRPDPIRTNIYVSLITCPNAKRAAIYLPNFMTLKPKSGIILSNSVLRAVHGQLDWCVRNSYSPHHHENLGRCVLHAAHQACTPHLQVPTAPLSAPGPLRAARRAPGLHPPPAGTYCPPLSTWAAACCTPRTRPAPPTCRYLLPPSQHLGRCVLHAAHQACTPHLQVPTAPLSAPGPLRAARRAPGLHPHLQVPTAPSQHLGRCVLHAAHQACTPHLQVPTAPSQHLGRCVLHAAHQACTPHLQVPTAPSQHLGRCVLHAAHQACPPTCRYLLPPSQHLGRCVLHAAHQACTPHLQVPTAPSQHLGRCVLHAAHQACTPHLQGETYVSARLESPPQLTPALADAVTQHPASEPALLHQLHAYVSRVLLERDAGLVRALRAAVSVGTRRHPAGFRNATWPGGLRAEPGLAAPPPDSRFDHLRWTGFNATHAFMPSELKALAPLDTVHKEALDLVLQSACAWAQRRWGARAAALVEGAMRWEPATSLRYRLLLRLTARDGDDAQNVPMLRQVEVVRLLGAARLVPVPYVTESARLHLVLPVLAAAVDDAAAFLRRYEAVCLQKDKNTDLIIVSILALKACRLLGAARLVPVPYMTESARHLISDAVLVSEDASQPPFASDLRAAAAALANKYRTTADVLTAVLAPGAATEEVSLSRAARAACDAALARLPRDSLLVLADPRMEFNEDFLNRARMNSISGVQWYLPRAFGRFATYAHPRALQPDGSRPQHHTGRFTQRRPVAAFYRGDYAQALAEWSASGGSPDASVADILAGGAVRCLRAPEPGLVLQPPPPPCQGDERLACLTKLREAGEFDYLELGAKHALAKLLLEEQAERER
ncbi:hypothetical protein MSG28_013884 [Choristoneura fumiferana]|uniref:Uncharacterized protein n=1 Tax=Choristoneura fumiferana TaxID=7141 RepID=A0ACC0K9F9_CHOFU|nr:hypothetical protein MSG28_013884 [Choristoneura fumiferana]